MKHIKYRVTPSTAGKDFFWNTAGSLVYALHSLLLLAIVTRLAGTDMAGIFSLTFSMAQMMYMVGCFETNNILVTDTDSAIGVRDTLVFRLFTNLLMFGCGAAFAAMQGFGGEKSSTFALLLLHMSLLSWSELCQSHLFRNKHLELAGQSKALCLGLDTLVFTLVLALTHSTAAAILAMCGATLLWLVVFDLPYLRGVGAAWRGTATTGQAIGRLLRLCLPLLAVHLVLSYIINSPKLAIDLYLSLTAQSYFGYLIMPASFINLLSLFFVWPQMPHLADSFHSGRRAEFLKTVGRLALWVLAISVLALVGGGLLGIPVLSAFYGVDLTGYTPVLLVTLLGGCFYAFATMFDMVATAMRVHQWNLPVYLIAALLAVVVTPLLVRSYGLMGAAAAYAVLVACLALGSGLVIAIRLAQKR